MDTHTETATTTTTKKTPAEIKAERKAAMKASNAEKKARLLADKKAKKTKANEKAKALKAKLKAKAAEKAPKEKAPKAKAEKAKKEKVQKPAKETADDAVAHVPGSTVKLTSNMAPSVEIATQLQAAFDHFNKTLFEGNLEPVIFSNCRLKKALGYFWPKQWARRKEMKGLAHEIGLDFARLHGENDKQVLSTLAHEMAHLHVEMIGKSPKKGYHCKYWVAAMHRIGLTPVILDTKGAPTGKATGPNSSHDVDKGGKFDVACDELLKTGFSLSWASQPVVEPEKKPKKAKAGAKAKHTCPECGANMWGKPSAVLLCTGTTTDKHEPTEMECDREAFEDEAGAAAGDEGSDE